MRIKQNFFNDIVSSPEFINLSEYGLEDTWQNLVQVFLTEKEDSLHKQPLQKSIQDWLQGLCSACNYPYESRDILTQYQDYTGAALTESQQYELNCEYWHRLAYAVFRKIKKYL